MDLVQFNVSRVRGSFCQVGEEVKHTDIRIRFSALIRCRLFIGTFLSYELRICVHVLCTYVTKEPWYAKYRSTEGHLHLYPCSVLILHQYLATDKASHHRSSCKIENEFRRAGRNPSKNCTWQLSALIKQITYCSIKKRKPFKKPAHTLFCVPSIYPSAGK